VRQFVFLTFLVVYGILIVTQFHHNPFINQGRNYEIFVLLYVCGIAFEEALQARLLPAACICISY